MYYKLFSFLLLGLIFIYTLIYKIDTWNNCSYLTGLCVVPADTICYNGASCSCENGVGKCYCFNGYSGENCEILPGNACLQNCVRLEEKIWFGKPRLLTFGVDFLACSDDSDCAHGFNCDLTSGSCVEGNFIPIYNK